jgi:hypothetical protein
LQENAELKLYYFTRYNLVSLCKILGFHGADYEECHLKDLAFLRSLRWLLVTDSVVATSPILVTLLMEAIGSSKTSVHTKVTRRSIPEGDTFHSHRHETRGKY